MRVSALQMMLAMFRLPVIAWHLGRAGALGHIAKITLLPGWMRHLCGSLDRMVRSGNARRDAGGALAEAQIRLGRGSSSSARRCRHGPTSSGRKWDMR